MATIPSEDPTQSLIPPTAPDPAHDPNAWVRWWAQYKRAARPLQIGVGCASLLVVCSLCGGLAAALGNHSTPPAAAVTQATSTAAPALATDTQVATDTPAATDTAVPPTATPKPLAWQTVQTFSGNGISKTAPFTVTADQWKIVWSCNPAAYGSSYNLIADLTVPGDQFGQGVVNSICTNGDATTTSGETMEYTAGTFYLDVNSEASWTFQVQVYR